MACGGQVTRYQVPCWVRGPQGPQDHKKRSGLDFKFPEVAAAGERGCGGLEGEL